MSVDWEQLSEGSIEKAKARLTSCQSVLGGFGLLVDRIKHITSEELRQLIHELEANSLGPIRVAGGGSSICLGETKGRATILSRRDFVELLIACVASGDPLEVPIGDQGVFEWLNSKWAKSSKLRLGGQPAHMALAACAFVRKIVLAGWPVPRHFANLMPNVDNLYIVESATGRTGLRPMRECKGGRDHNYANWATEFPGGLEIWTHGFELRSPRAGRFIASWFPRGEWMKPGTSKCLRESKMQVTHAFLSGCQLLCPNAENGRRWQRQIVEFATAVRALSERPGCRAVHYEMGTIQSVPLLRTVIEKIFPQVHSVGCNEVELAQVLDAAGCKKLASQIRGGKSIANVYEGATYLVQRWGFHRLHVHTWEFHVSVSRARADAHTAERDALLFGAVMGAAKTYARRHITDWHVRRGLKIPFSTEGLKKVTDVHNNPGPLGLHIEQGAFRRDDTVVCIVPGRVKPGLDSTVGLGDTLSSMAFLAATA